jgi:hypothetical protein
MEVKAAHVQFQMPKFEVMTAARIKINTKWDTIFQSFAKSTQA